MLKISYNRLSRRKRYITKCSLAVKKIIISYNISFLALSGYLDKNTTSSLYTIVIGHGVYVISVQIIQV